MPKPKQTRKRKHPQKHEEIEYELDAPKSKFRPFNADAQAEEEQVSHILFGGASNFLKCLEEAEQEPGSSGTNLDSGVGEDDTSDSDKDQRKPAWFDDDDDGIEVGQALDAQNRTLPNGGVNARSNKYSNLLENKFKSIVGTPKWASLDAKAKKNDGSDSEDDDEILRTCGFIRKSPKVNLGASVLEYKKVKDLNCETYNEGPYINAIEFHPTSSAALVAGNGGVATLFAVDGKRNNKLHSVALERFPILCAKFTNHANEALLGSRHPHIFSYDLTTAKPIRINLPIGVPNLKKFVESPDSTIIAAAGKWGEVHLLTSASKEKIATLKQESDVTDLSFNPQGNLLFGHSDSGLVTIWDVNTRRVIHKFLDEGCLQGSALAFASSGQFVATGSAQGVVNLYGVEDVLKHKQPKPRKTILNLTTAISSLRFNASSEILGMASSEIPNAVKLFHVASGTVFKNFPSFETKMGYVNVLNFSPRSGFVAFGNRKSVGSLYRLKHFKNY